jgi:hypothetical protein
MADVEVEEREKPLCVMSGEQIVRDMHELSDETLLTPEQMASVMQATSETLKNMRATGDGPVFVKLGGGTKSPVRYPVGEYRKWRAAHTYKNTSQLSVSRFGGMADFLSNGMGGDEFIVAKDADGIQWDFWEAIKAKADIVDVQWKTMDEILDGFRHGAQARFARREKQEFEEIGKNAPPGIRTSIDD